MGGAGIGGGNNGHNVPAPSLKGNGYNIKITGGTVAATGGQHSAGIGGGWHGKGSNFTVSGDALVKTQGGKGNSSDGKGACMGNGGYCEYRLNTRADGEEVKPDTSGLTTGCIEFYEPGADMDEDAPTSVITAPKPGLKAYNGTVDGTNKIGDKVILNGIEWIVVGIEGDVLKLASVRAFTEEQLKDLEALIKILLTNAQLEKLIADKTTGERVFLADEDIAKEYFGGEAGHIVIRAEKSILG